MSFVIAAALLCQTTGVPLVGRVPEKLRQEWKLSPVYVKCVMLRGFPILGSAKVSDRAMLEAADVVEHMLDGLDRVREAMIANRIRCVVMSPKEQTTDVPEHSDLKPRDYWDKRARGLGATKQRPAVSCGEENLLNLKGDRYPKECILVHEFAHAIHLMGLNEVDREFDRRLQACFICATGKKLWKGTYAATDYREYWAEAVQDYFDCNNPADSQHNDANTREKLAAYDPEIFQLIDETFRKNKWRYVRYDRRFPPPQPKPAVRTPPRTGPLGRRG